MINMKIREGQESEQKLLRQVISVTSLSEIILSKYFKGIFYSQKLIIKIIM